MKTRLLLSTVLLLGFAVALPLPAHAQQGGVTLAPGAPDTATKAKSKAPGKKAAKDDAAAAAPAKSGREAARQRQRACGAEWKADKAAGKVAAGMKWPKYWSECNTRKKAQGA